MTKIITHHFEHLIIYNNKHLINQRKSAKIKTVSNMLDIKSVSKVRSFIIKVANQNCAFHLTEKKEIKLRIYYYIIIIYFFLLLFRIKKKKQKEKMII